MAPDSLTVPRTAFVPSHPFLEAVTLIGVSYRTAGLELRSQLSFAGDRLCQLRERLRTEGAEGVLVLSTCNRTELYVSGMGHGGAVNLVSEASGLSIRELEGHLYVKSGAAAAEHLFRVACGLDSAALGETEILAQVRAAWRDASEAKTMGGALDALCRRAINVSKRVRTETDLCKHVTSVASMAVRWAASSADGLVGRSVVLLGAGAIAERVAKEISLIEGCRCTVVNRTAARGEALATRYGFDSAPLADLAGQVSRADVVFAAVSGSDFLLTPDVMGERATTVVDLGVPRAVAPMPARVQVIDIEALTSACAANARIRAGAISEAEAILEEELREFLAECGERDFAPAIGSLVQLGERVRQENLDWALANLEGLSAAQRKVVEDMALRIVRGVLHGPISALKTTSLPLSQRAALAQVLQGDGD